MVGQQIPYNLWKPKFFTVFTGAHPMTHAHTLNKISHTFNTETKCLHRG